jgi:geranylgeranyl diphosphate synthase type II
MTITPTQFHDLMLQRRSEIENALDQALPTADTTPPQLHEAMRHSVQAGGKRLRPTLVLAAHELFPSPRNPMPAAVAVECIHSYSLVHDDLPAMDDSTLRRGQPTCHVAYDEATAILVGDALLTLAFQILADSYEDEPTLSVALSRVLSKAAGSAQLIGGQMDDLLAENDPDPDPDLLASIHSRKTAALIIASLEMGALMGERGNDEEFIALTRNMGLSLGQAFQAIDDVLDATALSDQLGKSADQDGPGGKCTLVTYHGLEEAKRIAAQRTEEAKEACRKLGGDHGFLLQLIEWLGSRDH